MTTKAKDFTGNTYLLNQNNKWLKTSINQKNINKYKKSGYKTKIQKKPYKCPGYIKKQRIFIKQYKY